MGGVNKVDNKLHTVDFLTFEMVEMTLFPLLDIILVNVYIMCTESNLAIISHILISFYR